MSFKNLKAQFKQCFSDIFSRPRFDENLIEKYFSKRYIQKVNGETLNYQDFVNHIKALKEVVTSAEFTFEHIVAEDNKVCSFHTIDYMKKDGSSGKARVIGYFEYEDGKLIYCDEYTQHLEGDKKDADLGSRR